MFSCAHPKYGFDQVNTLSNGQSEYFKAKTQLVETEYMYSILNGSFSKARKQIPAFQFHMLVPNIMPVFEIKRVKNLHVNMAFLEPIITYANGGGDLHAGMQVNVDKIITIFSDEGILTSLFILFLYFSLCKMIHFWTALLLFS